MTTIRFRRPQRWFGALALALTLALAASGPALTADPSPAPSGDLTQIDLPINPTAFVQIEVQGATREGDPYTETGFGLIVDPSGLILAPANLVAPDAPGVAIRYGDWNIAATINSITVHASPTIGAPASATYTGTVLAADGYLDVAVVGLEAAGVTFAAVPTSSATRNPGEKVVVIDAGPLVLGGKITPTAYEGTITEEGTYSRIPDDPAWLDTDVPGFDRPSGAVLVTDESGLGLALPTSNPAYAPATTVWGWLPSLINPLLVAGATGASYTSPYVVAGTGTEAYLARGWFAADDPCAAAETDMVDSYPPGTNQIAAAWDATGMTEGEDVYNVWWDPIEQILDAVGEFTWDSGSEGCVWAGFSAEEGSSLGEREYAVSVFVGGTLRQVTFMQTEVQSDQPAGSFNVVGRVVDADTGEPIEFAFVTVLKPGVDLGTWFDNPDETQVASTAITDENGEYSTEPPVAPAVYPFLIQAFGYQTIGGNLNLSEGGFLPDIALTSLE
jgi:hypothetical protein